MLEGPVSREFRLKLGSPWQCSVPGRHRDLSPGTVAATLSPQGKSLYHGGL